MKDTAVVMVYIPERNIREDLEIPLNITANELIQAIASIYSLELRQNTLETYYLKADSPKCLIQGGETLKEFGIREGTEIRIWNR